MTKDRDWIVHWLHRAATISAIGTIVGVLAACLFRSWHRVDSTVHPLFGTPTAPERPRWRDDEVARADEDLRRTWIENLGIAATTAAETAVNLVQRAAYLAAAIETAMINKIAAFGALSARHAAMTVRFAGRTGVETVYVVPAVVRRFVRAVGLPTVALAAGIYATWGSATRITSYLHDGPIVDAIAGVGLGIVSVALVFVAWGSMIGGPVGPIAQSVSNIIANVGAQAGLFVVAAGWVDGLAGSLGVGPMRVGPVTIVGTVILAAAVFRASARPRRVATPDES